MSVGTIVLPVLLAVALGTCEGAAMEYYVSPKGNDAWSGRVPDPNRQGTDGPFRTLAKAAVAVKPGDVCSLRAGVYRETLRPEVSGQPGKPILFRNHKEEVAILTGADPLGEWRREEGGLCSAPMEWDLEDQNQIFAGETMLTEARWPKSAGGLLQPARAEAEAGTPTTLTDPNLPGDADAWKGALLWCAGGSKWVCWSGRVTAFDAATKTLTFECKEAADKWYTPRKGSEYVLMGVRAALDAEGEWWYDRAGRRLYLIPPAGKDPAALAIEAKRRLHVVDLSGRAHVHLVGLHFRAGGILTDKDSSDLLLLGLRGQHVAHSYLRDTSGTTGVLVRGARNVAHSCEFAGSSGSVLVVQGADHKVVNCTIHEGNYGGKWSGTVKLEGRRHLLSHCTIRHSGRDLVSVHGLSEGLIQYNDLSHAGWLTHDLGMTYGHNTDFANTVLHHNWVHDNQAKGLAMGIYFDHLSHNVIVHSNAIWNVSGDAIRINNPSYFDLVCNNTCWNTNVAARKITSFDHSHRQDLYAVRWVNNLFNAPLSLPENAIVAGNGEVPDPGYTDPSELRFALKPGSPAVGKGVVVPGITQGETPDPGAFPTGAPAWKAGHDFAHPPTPEPEWAPADVAWMNMVRNAGFEFGTLEGWARTDAGAAQITPGNGWGNNWGSNKPPEETGTCKFELRLGGGVDGVEQRIERLRPATQYTLSAWVKVAEGETVCLGVKGHGAPEATASSSNVRWTRLVLEFTTGRETTAATLFLRKTSPGPGHAWCDNVGLPRTP